MFKKFISIILILTFTISAQEIKFYGEAKQGGIIIGEGKNVIGVTLDKTKLQVDKNGVFIFGFDRDAKGKFNLKVKFKDKKVENIEYNLEKKQFEEQKLQIANKYVTPPKKLRKRIQREAQLMNSARVKVGKVKDAFFMEGFVYPVDSVDIRAAFGLQRILNGKPSNVHNGLDFGGVEGDSIRAITDGIVCIAGKNFFYNGNFILLDHGQGLTSIYLHMSKIFAKDNQKVRKGEVIGLIGATGRATGPHLHLGVQWYKKRIDPMSLFQIKF